MILRTILLSLFLLTSSNILAKTYVFVSFSMGDEALKSYYLEAQKEEASLVMQGLRNNSFLETKAKATELGIDFDINPNLFKKYKITAVPTIIVDDDNGQIKKLTGHISLRDVLEIMNRGD